jgi:hypothetical protein
MKCPHCGQEKRDEDEAIRQLEQLQSELINVLLPSASMRAATVCGAAKRQPTP